MRNRCLPDHNIGSRNWSGRMAGTLRRISIRDELFPGRCGIFRTANVLVVNGLRAIARDTGARAP